MDLKEFLLPELWVLVPVLYLIGAAIKKSRMRDDLIPLILGLLGILMSAVSVFSSCELNTESDVFKALFTSLTQGVLIAGAAVYSNQLVVQARKGRNTGESGNTNETKGEDDNDA